MTVDVAYIVGNYPAVSHTFIDREIQSLRSSGQVGVHTISLRQTPASELLTDRDRQEAEQTWNVLPPSLPAVFAAHARWLLTNPRRYLRTLRLATTLGRPGLRGAAYRLAYFAEAGLVASHLRRRKITHLHAHFANSASWVALLAARLSGGTWSFTMHGPTEFDDIHDFAVPQKIREAQFVACIGDYCRSQLMRFAEPADWDKLLVVRCGVDPQQYAPPAVERSAASGATTILSVARLMPDKGQRILVHAVAELVRGGWAGTLMLVGDGPDRAALERLVADLGITERVEFAGSVGQDRIPELYRGADVFVLSSFAEGIPVVLMEAMATELPVVATSIMGVRELVADGEAGLVVPPARADLLAAALARLDADPALRRRLGEAGRARVLEEFTHPGAVAPLQEALLKRD